MALVAACTPAETPDENPPMEDETPLDNGTPDSGNPLDEEPTNDNMDSPLDENSPTDDNQGNIDLEGVEFGMNEDIPKEAFIFLEDELIETNDYGYFEAV